MCARARARARRRNKVTSSSELVHVVEAPWFVVNAAGAIDVIGLGAFFWLSDAQRPAPKGSHQPQFARCQKQSSEILAGSKDCLLKCEACHSYEKGCVGDTCSKNGV